MYASSTGRAAFMGVDPFINPLCVGICILWINGCILSLITDLLLPYCQPHRSIVSLDETLAKYESVQRLTSEAKMPSTIEE
jgi:hypothetical protein